MKEKNIPVYVFHFNTYDDTVCVYNVIGGNTSVLEYSNRSGTEAKEFLARLLLAKYEAGNKVLAFAKLNTWYWVQVLGMSGKEHGGPKMLRHTMPDGLGVAFWQVNRTEKGYEIVPFNGPFVCRYSHKKFDQYPGQTTVNISQPYQILHEVFHDFVCELEAVGEGEKQTSSYGRFLVSELDRINDLLDDPEISMEDVTEFTDGTANWKRRMHFHYGRLPHSISEAFGVSENSGYCRTSVGFYLRTAYGIELSESLLREVCELRYMRTQPSDEEFLQKVKDLQETK